MQHITADNVIDDLIRRERGKVDRAEDRGGPTNNGITLATLSRRLGRQVTKKELFALNDTQIREIYRQDYVEPYLFIENPALLGLVVDCAVQHGGVNEPDPGDREAVRWLQRAAGATVDGIIGPQTRRAVEMADPAELYRAILGERIPYYGKLIAHDPERQRATGDGYDLQAIFAYGWANRVAEFVRACP